MKKLLFIGMLFTHALQGAASKHADFLRNLQPGEEDYAGPAVTCDSEETRRKLQNALSAQSSTLESFEIYRCIVDRDPRIQFRNETKRQLYLAALSYLAEEQEKVATPAAPQTLTIDMTQGAQLSTDDPADLFGGDNELPVKENDEAPAQAQQIVIDFAQRREEMGYSHRVPGYEDDVEPQSLDDLFGPQPYIKKPATPEVPKAPAAKPVHTPQPQPLPTTRRITEKVPQIFDTPMELRPPKPKPVHTPQPQPLPTTRRITEKVPQIFDTPMELRPPKPKPVHTPQPAPKPAPEKKEPTELEIALAERKAAQETLERLEGPEVVALRKKLAAAREEYAKKVAYQDECQKAYDEARERCEKLTAVDKKSTWQKAKEILSTVPEFFTTHKKADVKKDFYATLNHKETKGFGAHMMRYLKHGFCNAAAFGVITCILAVGHELHQNPKQSIATIFKNLFRPLMREKAKGIGFITASGGWLTVMGGTTQAIQDVLTAAYEWCSGSDEQPGRMSQYFTAGITTPFTAYGLSIGLLNLLSKIGVGSGKISVGKGGYFLLATMFSATGVLSQAISDLSSLCYTKATELLGYGHEIEYNGRTYQWR